MSLADLKILARQPDTATVFQGVPDIAANGAFTSVPLNKVEFSPDGTRFAGLTLDGITIYDSATLEKVGGVDIKHAIALAWSPQGGIMQTFERPDREKGNQHKNLKLWDLKTGEVLLQLFQKAFSREAWPAIQLTADEGLAFHAQPNAVNVYNPRDFALGILRKLHLKGLGGFAVAPGTGTHLAAYVPEARGTPGFVAIYDHTQLVKSGDPPQALCRRSFFKASNVQLKWAAGGGGLLAETSSDSDSSNRSYYGETKLHFLSAEKGVADCLVPLKEGPVHDSTWSPDGTCFAVVAGFMPAQTLIFDSKCKQVADLGAGPHNLARFSRFGRFLALAGFGNLPGDLVIHERKGDAKWKQLAATRVNNGVSMEWAPDGRHLMTATLAPRLRVDNGFCIYRHDGTLIAQQQLQELLEAVWLPAPSASFEDRPSSPRASAKAAAASTQLQQPAPRAGGYVPPSKRAAGVNPEAQPDFSAAYARHAAAGKASAAAAAGRTLVSGGAAPTSKSAARRARKKAGAGDGQQEAAAGSEVDGMAAVTTGVEQLSTANGNGNTAAAAAAAPPAAAASATEAGGGGAADAAKRVRNLQKKLRQVQQLKERVSKEGQAALDADQRAKLATEDALIEEIRANGGDA